MPYPGLFSRRKLSGPSITCCTARSHSAQLDDSRRVDHGRPVCGCARVGRRYPDAGTRCRGVHYDRWRIGGTLAAGCGRSVGHPAGCHQTGLPDGAGGRGGFVDRSRAAGQSGGESCHGVPGGIGGRGLRTVRAGPCEHGNRRPVDSGSRVVWETDDTIRRRRASAGADGRAGRQARRVSAWGAGLGSGRQWRATGSVHDAASPGVAAVGTATTRDAPPPAGFQPPGVQPPPPAATAGIPTARIPTARCPAARDDGAAIGPAATGRAITGAARVAGVSAIDASRADIAAARVFGAGRNLAPGPSGSRDRAWKNACRLARGATP